MCLEQISIPMLETNAERIRQGYRNKTRASSAAWVGRSLTHIIRKSMAGWGGILPRKCDLAQSADLRTVGWNERGRGPLWTSERHKGGKKQGAPGASRGNISGNKGMGTSVSMVIPSSGFGRENALRARLDPFPRAASRRVAPGRAEGQETPRTPSSPIAERIREQGRRERAAEMKRETNSIFVERRSPRRDAARRGAAMKVNGERRFKLIDRPTRPERRVKCGILLKCYSIWIRWFYFPFHTYLYSLFK